MSVRLVKKGISEVERMHRETLYNFGSHDEKALLHQKWQSRRVYHPKWGPVLVTRIHDRCYCTVDIETYDLKETIGQKKVYIDELFLDFGHLERLAFAFKKFFQILRTPLSIHKDG